MIAKQELRYGNYVMPLKDNFYGEYKDEPCQVNSIEYRGINAWQDMGASGNLSYSEIDPIRLTDEWLLKLGFKRESIDDKWGRVFRLKNCNYFLRVVNFSRPIDTAQMGFQLEYSDDSNWFAIKRIDYIHTLQNVIFEVTGIELTIKEK